MDDPLRPTGRARGEQPERGIVGVGRDRRGERRRPLDGVAERAASSDSTTSTGTQESASAGAIAAVVTTSCGRKSSTQAR
jgi:hypothetical protein